MRKRRELTENEQSIITCIYDNAGLGKIEIGQVLALRENGTAPIDRLQQLSLVHRSYSEPDTIRLLASSIPYLEDKEQRRVVEELDNVAKRLQELCRNNRSIAPIALKDLRAKKKSADIHNLLRILQQVSLVAEFDDAAVKPWDSISDFQSFIKTLETHEAKFDLNREYIKTTKRDDIAAHHGKQREEMLAAAMVVIWRYREECVGKKAQYKEMLTAQSVVDSIYRHQELLWPHGKALPDDRKPMVENFRGWLKMLDPDYRENNPPLS